MKRADDMSLYLIELQSNAADRPSLQPLFDRIASLTKESGGELIEIQVATDLQRVYFVVEHTDRGALEAALRDAGLAYRDVAPVRLVGTTLDVLKAARPAANYLVEWDLPAGLAMDTYLERKRAKSPLYANVPEVKFLRTYVREDMVKCLCFYDAPDEAAVRRAREAVSTPVDRVSRLSDAA